MPNLPKQAWAALSLIGSAAVALAPAVAGLPKVGVQIHVLGTAQEGQLELKLATGLPASHPLQAGIDSWADALEESAHGSITVANVPPDSLPKSTDLYDLARDGIADFALVNPGFQPGRFPIASVGDLPFQFRDGRSGTGALDAWYRKYAAREMKDVHYCFAVVQNPGTLHSRRPVLVPDDLKGLNIQSVNATVPMSVLLGATNLEVPAANVRDLVERGKIDAVFQPWSAKLVADTVKTLKYHIDVPFYASTFLWVMNKTRYDALKDAQKSVVNDHCTTDWAVRFASSWADADTADREKLIAQPGQVVETLTPAQLAEWRKATEPLYANWSTALNMDGTDPDEAYRELESNMSIYHADY